MTYSTMNKMFYLKDIKSTHNVESGEAFLYCYRIKWQVRHKPLLKLIYNCVCFHLALLQGWSRDKMIIEAQALLLWNTVIAVIIVIGFKYTR